MIILLIGKMLSSTFVVRSCRVCSSVTGSTLSNQAHIFADYFTKILEDDLKAIVKPQYVDRIPKAIKGTDKTVETLITAQASMDNLEEVLDILGKRPR